MKCRHNSCNIIFSPVRKNNYFCSLACRKRDAQDKSNAARRLKNKRDIPIFCDTCGIKFNGRNTNVKYCSKCKIINDKQPYDFNLNEYSYTLKECILDYEESYGDFSQDPDINIKKIFLSRGDIHLRTGLGQMIGAEV